MHRITRYIELDIAIYQSRIYVFGCKQNASSAPALALGFNITELGLSGLVPRSGASPKDFLRVEARRAWRVEGVPASEWIT